MNVRQYSVRHINYYFIYHMVEIFSGWLARLVLNLWQQVKRISVQSIQVPPLLNHGELL
jgi:hypothetical protein